VLISSNNSHSQSSGAELEAERFVQSALDALSSHIAVLDQTGRIIGVNASWRHFAERNGFVAPNFGVGISYLDVCDDATLYNSSDASLVASGIRDIIGGHLTEFEMEYPCHSPIQRRWFVIRVSRFDWHDQVRLIVAHHNVTELKQAQIDLSASKQRMEAVLININNGILTLNTYGQIESANPAAARIFGYEISDMTGLFLGQILEEFHGRSLKDLNDDAGHELTGIRKDGTVFPMYLALNAMQMDDGMLYTCIIKDITLRKQAESDRLEREKLLVALEKERELRELKNRFLSMMSHELRTPLASISLSYDMLKKYGAVSTQDEKNQALDNIRQQVDYLTDMMSDVMTLSRSEYEGLEAMLEDADVATFCRDIVEEFQFNYRTHQIEFESEEKNVRAGIDRKLLRRALTNLIINAMKYSPHDTLVVLTLARQGDDGLLIQVRDSGIGIPEEDQPRLFEPFHRARNVNNIPGTGLGLPITKQAVELHGGEIGFTTGEDGTTFSIYLPLNRE
jgi:two-component system sensor kinase FixL